MHLRFLLTAILAVIFLSFPAAALKPLVYLSGKISENSLGELVNSKSVLKMKELLEENGAEVHLINHLAHNPSSYKEADGVVFMGNDNDIDPKRYSEKPHEKTKSELDRDNYNSEIDYKHGVARASFEEEAMRVALKNNTPIFAVCGGAQRLNVLLGGNLIQHTEGQVQKDKPNTRYINERDPRIAVEALDIKPETKLAKAVSGLEFLKVNSLHHQAIDRLGKGLKISAMSKPHGTVEAVESSNENQYIMAVQWHPEHMRNSELSKRLVQDFIKSVRN